MSVVFEDNRIDVINAIDSNIEAALEEVAGELESQVKRNTAVKTGKTKSSWEHKVYKTGEGYEAVVGSNYENAIWEEFGTGDYALHGDGRKGGWTYKDEKGQWHRTNGKKPRRPLWNAYVALKPSIENRLKKILGGE